MEPETLTKQSMHFSSRTIAVMALTTDQQKTLDALPKGSSHKGHA